MMMQLDIIVTTMLFPHFSCCPQPGNSGEIELARDPSTSTEQSGRHNLGNGLQFSTPIALVPTGISLVSSLRRNHQQDDHAPNARGSGPPESDPGGVHGAPRTWGGRSGALPRAQQQRRIRLPVSGPEDGRVVRAALHPGATHRGRGFGNCALGTVPARLRGARLTGGAAGTGGGQHGGPEGERERAAETEGAEELGAGEAGLEESGRPGRECWRAGRGVHVQIEQGCHDTPRMTD